MPDGQLVIISLCISYLRFPSNLSTLLQCMPANHYPTTRSIHSSSHVVLSWPPVFSSLKPSNRSLVYAASALRNEL